ncbi:DUF4402 domain-containing protein [Halomonas lysinitropha]|uniref:DUF4402 domain-containing protein n=1 Tax=Halomonas lysinitropha TaxID=2607506 RepID=A0A5K1HZH5_9GAMM|nr:DUF4402 domain-containing protein [Halomonas lysinitropha]VVZ94994.1 hypothetical protein HALO32_01058 [Halomonas lysinitropha]
MNSSAFIRKNFRLTVLASVVALGAFGASSSFAASATTNVSSTVIEPIAITKSADLVFGKFAPGAGGSVTVDTAGTRSATGAILSTVGSSPTAAKFDVTGDNDATYSITWGGVTELTDSESTETMALTKISDLTAGGATTGEVDAGVLSATGAQSIYLGGTLTVGGTQAAGTYTGDVTATVEYN